MTSSASTVVEEPTIIRSLEDNKVFESLRRGRNVIDITKLFAHEESTDIEAIEVTFYDTECIRNVQNILTNDVQIWLWSEDSPAIVPFSVPVEVLEYYSLVREKPDEKAVSIVCPVEFLSLIREQRKIKIVIDCDLHDPVLFTLTSGK